MRFCLLFLFNFLFGFVFSQKDLVPGIGFEVDRLPENYGGKQGLNYFLENHLIYPKEDLDSKRSGIVKIKFICSKKGEILYSELIQKQSESMNQEAIRLFSLLQFHPALKANDPVDYESEIEIPFFIKEYRRSIKRQFFKASQIPILPVDSNIQIFLKPEKPAGFIEGRDSLNKFIVAQLEYPTIAKQQNLEGIVNLSFVVETNGRISNFEILNSVGGGCNEEAERVISLTKWVPAKHNGKYVRSKISLPIVFSLKSNFKDNTMGTQNFNAQ